MITTLQYNNIMDIINKNMNKSKTQSCFVEYEIYLDKDDLQTDFCCDRKEIYLDIFNKLKQEDKNIKIIMLIYNEEEGRFYSDEVYVSTNLSEKEIINIFDFNSKKYNDYLNPTQIEKFEFPRDEHYIINGWYVNKDGSLNELNNHFTNYEKQNLYSFWWY